MAHPKRTIRLEKKTASNKPKIFAKATPNNAKERVYPIASIKFSVLKKLGVTSPMSRLINSGQGSTVVIARSAKIIHPKVMLRKIIVVLTNAEEGQCMVNELLFDKGDQDR